MSWIVVLNRIEEEHVLSLKLETGKGYDINAWRLQHTPVEKPEIQEEPKEESKVEPPPTPIVNMKTSEGPKIKRR
jgi:hypothetical protein